MDLRKQQIRCGKNRIARLMRLHGIKASLNKRHAYKTAKVVSLFAPNTLNRGFTVPTVNMVWTTDITYLWTSSGWSYLCVYMDLFSRKIISWSFGTSATTSLVLDAFQRAIKIRKPGKALLIHSDQGCQYTSHSYADTFKDGNFVQSMSRRGNCWDNAAMESFFSLLKAEIDFGKRSLTFKDVRRLLFEYIEMFYNRRRSHSALDYCSPVEWESCYSA